MYFFRIYLSILFLHPCMFPAWYFRQRTCMAQGLVIGVHNDTWTHLCLQFEWFSVGYEFLWRSLLPFSFSVFNLVCFTPRFHLIFDTFFRYVCMCGLVWLRISLTVIFSLCTCGCMSRDFFFFFVCAFVWVVVWFEIYWQLLFYK